MVFADLHAVENHIKLEHSDESFAASPKVRGFESTTPNSDIYLLHLSEYCPFFLWNRKFFYSNEIL